nr:uncharacterized protein LOC100226371 [Taeniopygia guttata]
MGHRSSQPVSKYISILQISAWSPEETPARMLVCTQRIWRSLPSPFLPDDTPAARPDPSFLPPRPCPSEGAIFAREPRGLGMRSRERAGRSQAGPAAPRSARTCPAHNARSPPAPPQRLKLERRQHLGTAAAPAGPARAAAGEDAPGARQERSAARRRPPHLLRRHITPEFQMRGRRL